MCQCNHCATSTAIQSEEPKDRKIYPKEMPNYLTWDFYLELVQVLWKERNQAYCDVDKNQKFVDFEETLTSE